MFIVFEGVDGSGKSTVSEKVFNLLKGKQKTKKIVFPSNENYGKKARESIKNNENDNIIGSHLLNDFLDNMPKIQACIDKGYNIVSDRYIQSYDAYQSILLGKEKIKEDLEKIKDRIITPDIIFILYASKHYIEDRITNRFTYKEKCNIEAKGIDFLMDVQRNYATMSYKGICLIDTSGLHANEVCRIVSKRIEKIINNS